MKKVMFLLLIFLFPFCVRAEELKMDWVKNFGGNNIDVFDGVLKTSNGEFIVYGYSYSTDIVNFQNKGEHDIVIVKYDKDGNMLWQTSWGGNNYDHFENLIQTSDGGFIGYGYSWSTDIEGLSNMGDHDAIIVKFNSSGVVEWQNNYGGNKYDHFDNILLTQDGNFIAFGYSYSTDISDLSNKGEHDVIIVKYNNKGEIEWQTSWGGNKYDHFENVIQTQDGGFIGIGYSDSTDIDDLINSGGKDAVIVKFDSSGEMKWQTSWGGNKYDIFKNIFNVSSDEFIVHGYSYSTNIDSFQNNGEYDAIILKYDKDGVLLWQTSWGGNNYDNFENILQLQNGEFIGYGYSYSTDIAELPNKGEHDAVIVKFNNNGVVEWQTGWGGNSFDHFENVMPTQDNGFIAFGYSYSTDVDGFTVRGKHDIIIVKYDKDGNMLWQNSWGGNKYDHFEKILQTQDGGFVGVGYSDSTDNENITNKGVKDAIILKYSIEYNLENIIVENGEFTLEQQGKYGIISPVADKGYEVDKIIVKDKEGTVLDLDVIELEDGTYSFELYTDVSVVVLFKEVLFNPKTGDVNYILCFYVMMILSLFGFGYLYLFRRNSVL